MKHSRVVGCDWSLYDAPALDQFSIFDLQIKRACSRNWKSTLDDLKLALSECPVWHGQQLWLMDCRDEP